jgi:hypothetical protein
MHKKLIKKVYTYIYIWRKEIQPALFHGQLQSPEVASPDLVWTVQGNW